MNKRILIIVFGILLTISFLLFAATTILNTFKSQREIPTPFPTDIRQESIIISSPPKSTLLIPTAPPQQGGGVDEDAPAVEASINEIAKLTPLLPYRQIQTLSSGKSVDIIISKPDASRPWVLPVFIGGIDYNVPENSPLLTNERNAFREAANQTFNWMKENGADSSVIFINWAEKAALQDRLESWIK